MFLRFSETGVGRYVRNNEKVRGCYDKPGRNSKYRKLNVGDRFGFGYYQGVPLRWKVIKKQNNDLMVISDEIICKRRFHKDSSTNK